MKKNSFRVLLCSALSLFILSSCDVNLIDSEYREAPNVTLGTQTVAISIPKISNQTKYISIYRISSGSGAPSNKSEGVNIGIIYPKYYSGDAYTFEDAYAQNGSYYYYRVRYYTSDSDYAYTKWSKKIEIPATHCLDYTLGLENSTMEFNSDSCTLKFTGGTKVEWTAASTGATPDLTASGEFEKFYIALRCEGVGSQLIPITDSQKDGTEEFNVRSMLPAEFFDRVVTVEGFVAVKTISNDKDDNIQLKFTEPSTVTVTGEIKVPAKSGIGGIDYS